jgi:hypothetical protein
MLRGKKTKDYFEQLFLEYYMGCDQSRTEIVVESQLNRTFRPKVILGCQDQERNFLKVRNRLESLAVDLNSEETDQKCLICQKEDGNARCRVATSVATAVW